MKVKREFIKKQNFSPSELVVKPSKGLIIKPGGAKWFSNEAAVDSEADCTTRGVSNLSSAKNEAEILYNQDLQTYRRVTEKRKDFAWIHTVLKSGTVCDKISAHVVMIQDSPVHNLDSVANLVSLVNTKGKRECLMAMDTLRELFLSDLLPGDKMLRTFIQHSPGEIAQTDNKNSELRNRKLVLWYFEDKLKAIYENLVKNLEAVSHDTVEKTKQKAVSVMAELLKFSPEQEHFLLEHLVNKIGDPSQKVGAHVCHLLGQIMVAHPNMKGVVSQEVERLLFRPNICDRTKYYCLCILNQIILSHEDKKIANHLIKIYFGLFKVCVKKGDVNNKLMSALLTGVTRAHPYAALGDDEIMDQLNAMYKMVHMVNFNISVQALLLIFQVLNSQDSLSERFYSALYRKLLDPEFATCTRHTMLLNLLFRALKKDVSSRRVKAFVKRLLQISLLQAPQLQCGILYLISSLAKTHKNLLDVVKPSLVDSDSDGEEHYEDVVEENDELHSSEDAPIQQTLKDIPASSWVHKKNQNSADKSKSSYDPLCRNPTYAGAEYSSMWELRFLRNCYHPSVSLFASQVSNTHDIKYSGDPLQDFTLARFLDRFVYRNPKKPPPNKEADQRRKVFGSKSLYIPSGARDLPVTSEKYLQQDEARVPVEESFIFKYLHHQGKSGVKKKDDGDSDIESVNSEEFGEILDKYNAEDDGKDELDFAKELTSQKSRKPKKSEADMSEDEDDFDSVEDGSDFEDPDFEDDDAFQEAFEDFDDDLKEADEMKNAFECEDFDDECGPSKLSKPMKKKKKQGLDEENLFASADQFSSLLEENTKTDSTTAEAFINRDKSDAKQILWERKRDQYVRGVDWKSKKFQKGFKKFKKGPKSFQKKEPNSFQKGGKKFKKNKK